MTNFGLLIWFSFPLFHFCSDTVERYLELKSEKHLELQLSFQRKKKSGYFLSVITVPIPLVWSFPMHSLLRTVVLNLSAHYNMILLKKYSIFPSPQKLNLFCFAIKVKQISFPLKQNKKDKEMRNRGKDEKIIFIRPGIVIFQKMKL